MRVIAGSLRSRPLRAPAGAETRPTSDRLRETLFNIIDPRIKGSRFADLYSGTGAVGIEAISRGAAQVLFVERAPLALAALRANLGSLGLRSGYGISERSVAATLRQLLHAPRPGQFDLIFLDPPYEATEEYASTLGVLGGGEGTMLLADDALVVAEHATRTPLPEQVGRLTRTRTRRQGDATLSFFALAAPAASSDGAAGE